MPDFGALAILQKRIQSFLPNVPIYLFSPSGIDIPAIVLDIDEIWTHPAPHGIQGRIRFKAHALCRQAIDTLILGKAMENAWNGQSIPLASSLTGVIRLDGTATDTVIQTARRLSHFYTLLIRS
jgi:hypothetical protein